MKQSGTENTYRDRVVLLFGRTGTGKSTLCQSIAQKLSIRLSSDYTKTRMIQIKTSTLLSKYFSESAKIVDDICTTLAILCKDEPCEFNCVLIDEVESLTMSRQRGCLNGESQDTLRATNALLTGFDRLKAYSNILFLCTSNMPELMDSAFLNRCSLQMIIEPPRMESRYAILRGELQRLIRINVISHRGQIPSLSDARQENNAGTDGVGSRLLDIVRYVGKIVAASPDGQENSARFLSQLPQEAIELYLRDEYCSLQMAFSFIERFLKIDDIRTSETHNISKADLVCGGSDKSQKGEDSISKTAIKIVRSEDGTAKRKIEICAVGDEVQVLEDLWNYLEGRRRKTRVISRDVAMPLLETHIQVENLQSDGRKTVGIEESGFESCDAAEHNQNQKMTGNDKIAFAPSREWQSA
jgi:MoxR-like ATPase